MSGQPGGFNPSVKRLYKDCLKIVANVALEHPSVNRQSVSRLVKQQFMQHKDETNPEKLSALKGNAMSALTNYVMFLTRQKQGEGAFKSKDLPADSS